MFSKNIINYFLVINIILTCILFYVLFYCRCYHIDKKVYIKKSDFGGVLGGRGVFANKFIKKGGIIEEGHLLCSSDDDELKCGIYQHYIYTRTDEDKYGGNIVFPLGNGGLYNHSYNNNAVLRSKNDTFTVFAIKDINKDEEIFTCYGCNVPNQDEHFDYITNHEMQFN